MTVRIGELPEDTISSEPTLWSDTIDAKVGGVVCDCEHRCHELQAIKLIDKNEIKRQEMIYELIQTERIYYRHLAIIANVRTAIITQPAFTRVVASPTNAR